MNQKRKFKRYVNTTRQNLLYKSDYKYKENKMQTQKEHKKYMPRSLKKNKRKNRGYCLGGGYLCMLQLELY